MEEDIKAVMMKKIAATEMRLAHIPCIVSNTCRMAVWSDVKEVLFLWCANPQCSVVLTALKHQLGYPASEVAMHPCTQLEQLMFLKQYIIVSPGTLLVDLNAIRRRSYLMLLHDVVKMKHSYSKDIAVMRCREMMITMSENYANTSIKIPLKTRKKLLPAVRRSSVKPSSSVLKREPNITIVDEENDKIVLTRNKTKEKNSVWVVKNKVKKESTEDKDFKTGGPVIDSVIYGLEDQSSNSALVPLSLLKELLPTSQGFLEDTVRLYVLGRCGQEGLTSVGQCTLEESIQLTRFLACQNGYDTPWFCLTTCSVLMSWADFWYGYNKRKDCVELDQLANDISVVTLSCQPDLKDTLCQQSSSSPLKQNLNNLQHSSTLDNPDNVDEPLDPIKTPSTSKMDDSMDSTQSSTSIHSKKGKRKRKGRVSKSTSTELDKADIESIDSKTDQIFETEKYVDKLRKKKELPAIRNEGNVRLTRSSVNASLADASKVDEVNDKKLKMEEKRSRDLYKKDRSKSTEKGKKSLKCKNDSNNSSVNESHRTKTDRVDKNSSASTSRESSIKQQCVIDKHSKQLQNVRIPFGDQNIDERKIAKFGERKDTVAGTINNIIESKTDVEDQIGNENQTYEDTNTDNETYGIVGIDVSIKPKRKKTIHETVCTNYRKRAEDVSNRPLLKISSAVFYDILPPKLRVKKKYMSQHTKTNAETSIMQAADEHVEEGTSVESSGQSQTVTTSKAHIPKYVSAMSKQIQLNTPMTNHRKPMNCGEKFSYKAVRSSPIEDAQNACSSATEESRPNSSEPVSDHSYPIVQGTPVYISVTKKKPIKGFMSARFLGSNNPVSTKATPRYTPEKLPEEIESNLKEQASKSICSISGNNDMKVVEEIKVQGKVICTASAEDMTDISQFESERVTMWRDRVNHSHRRSLGQSRLTKSADISRRRERNYTYRPTSSIYSYTRDTCSTDTNEQLFESALCAVYSQEKDIRASSPDVKEPSCSEACKISSVTDTSKATQSETSNEMEEFPNYGSSSSRTPDIYDEFARRRRPKVHLVKPDSLPQRLTRPGQSAQSKSQMMSSNAVQYRKIKPVDRRSFNHHSVGYTAATQMSQATKTKEVNNPVVQQRYSHALPKQFMNMPFATSVSKFIQSRPNSPVKYPSCTVCRGSVNSVINKHESDTALTSVISEPLLHTSCLHKDTDVRRSGQVDICTEDRNEESSEVSNDSLSDSKNSMSLLQKVDSFLDSYVSPRTLTENTDNLKTFMSEETGSEISQKGSECIKAACETNQYPFRHTKPDIKTDEAVSTVGNDKNGLQTETGGQVARINSQLYYSVHDSEELVPVSADVTIPANAQFYVQTSSTGDEKQMTKLHNETKEKQSSAYEIEESNKKFEKELSNEDMSYDIEGNVKDTSDENGNEQCQFPGKNGTTDDNTESHKTESKLDCSIDHLSKALSKLIKNSEQALCSMLDTEKDILLENYPQSSKVLNESKKAKNENVGSHESETSVNKPEEVESYRYITLSPTSSKSKSDKQERNFQEFVEETRAVRRKDEEQLRKKKFWASGQIQYMKFCQTNNSDKILKRTFKQRQEAKLNTKTFKVETDENDLKINTDDRRPKSTSSCRDQITQQLKPRPKTGFFQKQQTKLSTVEGDHEKGSVMKNDNTKKIKLSDKQVSNTFGRNNVIRPKTSQLAGEKKNVSVLRLSKSARQAAEIQKKVKEREQRGKGACEETFQVVTALRRLSIEGSLDIASKKSEARRNKLRSFVKEEIDKQRLEKQKISVIKLDTNADDKKGTLNVQNALQSKYEPNIDLNSVNVKEPVYNNTSNKSIDLLIGDNQDQKFKNHHQELDINYDIQRAEGAHDFEQASWMPYRKPFITQANPNCLTEDFSSCLEDPEATCYYSETDFIDRQNQESVDTEVARAVTCNLNSNDNNRDVEHSNQEPDISTLYEFPLGMPYKSGTSDLYSIADGNSNKIPYMECSSLIKCQNLEYEAGSIEPSTSQGLTHDNLDQKYCINHKNYHPAFYDPQMYGETNIDQNDSQCNIYYDPTNEVFKTENEPSYDNHYQIHTSNETIGYGETSGNYEEMYLRLTGPDGTEYHVTRDDPNFIPLIEYFQSQNSLNNAINEIDYAQILKSENKNCYDHTLDIQGFTENVQRDIENQTENSVEDKQLYETSYGQCAGCIDSLNYQNVIYGNGIKHLEWRPQASDEQYATYSNTINDDGGDGIEHYKNNIFDFITTENIFLPQEEAQTLYAAHDMFNGQTDNFSNNTYSYTANEVECEQNTTENSQVVHEDQPTVYIDRDEVAFFTDQVLNENEVIVCTENQSESIDETSENLPISSASTVLAATSIVNGNVKACVTEKSVDDQIVSEPQKTNSGVNNKSADLLGVTFPSKNVQRVDNTQENQHFRQSKKYKVQKPSKKSNARKTPKSKKKKQNLKETQNMDIASKEQVVKSSSYQTGSHIEKHKDNEDQATSADNISTVPSSSTLDYDCDDEFEIDDERLDEDYVPDNSDTSSNLSDDHVEDIGDIYEDVRKINESLGKSSRQKCKGKKKKQGKPSNSLNKMRKNLQKKYDITNTCTLKLNERNKLNKSSDTQIMSRKQTQVEVKTNSESFCNNEVSSKSKQGMNKCIKEKKHSDHVCLEKQNDKEHNRSENKSDNKYLITDRLSYYEMKKQRKKMKHKRSNKRTSVNEEDSDEEKQHVEETRAAEGFIKTQKMYFEILKNTSLNNSNIEATFAKSDFVPSVPAEVPSGIPLHGDRVITKAIADAEKALEGTGSLSEHEEEPQVIEDRINQCSYQLVEDEDHINLGGLAYYLDFVLPFVYINGYKYVPLKDIQTMFQPNYCVSNCTIPRGVLSKHKYLVKSFSTWDQVYKLELIKMKKGPTITTGDIVIKLDSLLNFLPDIVSEIVKLHHNTKLKRSQNCNIAHYKHFPLGQKTK